MTARDVAGSLENFNFDFECDLLTPAFGALLAILEGARGTPDEVDAFRAAIAATRKSMPPGWKPARRSGTLYLLGLAEDIVRDGGLSP